MGVVECGMELEELARSAERVSWKTSSGRLVGAQPCTWESQNPESQKAWRRVAQKAIQMCQAPEVHAKELAQELRKAWFLGNVIVSDDGDTAYPGAEQWENIPLDLRLSWEAVARHLATVVDWDELDDLGHLEAMWAEWVSRKLKG